MAKTTGSEFTNDEASYGVFQTPQVSYYVIDKSRSAQVIRDVMEEAMPEVCSQGSPTPKAYGVSDLFSAQLSSPSPKRQICHAHQLRDYVCPFCITFGMGCKTDKKFAVRHRRGTQCFCLKDAATFASLPATCPVSRCTACGREFTNAKGLWFQQQVHAIEQACDALLSMEVSSPTPKAYGARR